VTVDQAGRLDSVRVAVGGIGPAPATLAGLDSLRGLSTDDARLDAQITRSVRALPAIEDPRADEEYRREAAATLALRVVCEAVRRGSLPIEPVDPPLRVGIRPCVPCEERGEAAEIALTVNGDSRGLEVEPRLLLSDLLRERLGLHATHVGCEHGVCGACNVMVDGVAVRSCLMFAVQADGCHVQTLEGLRETPEVGTLANAFAAGHALQCGFCTPGFLVTLAELQARGAPIGSEQLVGNLCRCTGYAPILRAAEGSEW
jgi:aerobic-type carbon monoxide dehydrogenase small subunit (CoxS/CutS family)